MYIFHNGIMFSSLVEKIPTQLKQLSIAMYNYTYHCNTIEIIFKKKPLIRIVAVKEAVCYSLITNLSSYGEIKIPTLHILPYMASFKN